jgi:hypothetical protein
MIHSFTQTILNVLYAQFGAETGKEIYERSDLLQYINRKTVSANKGSKSRGSFGNLYAIYVILEDYINKGFFEGGNYSNYEGAMFSTLFKRQRELPFGGSLQNHSLNNRMSSEFMKFFPSSESSPIIRDQQTNRYWINQNFIIVKVGENEYNIAKLVITVIDEYVKTKQDSFQRFIEACQELLKIEESGEQSVIEFIISLLAPNTDARLFEIVSYSILKYYYKDVVIYWGYEKDVEKLTEENLSLYKTGRTNANDGGIDYVMKPLGRFFQVTETLDFRKYFLDIDKIQKFPITFVVKSTESVESLKEKIQENAQSTYTIAAIVKRYMDCIEELINLEVLKNYLDIASGKGYLHAIINEIILQSKIEFNYPDEEDQQVTEGLTV